MMFDEMTPTTLNPGSNEAIAFNCTCPVLDNSHGLGAYGGTVKDREGKTAFWINSNCPLHNGSTGVLLQDP